MNSVGNRKALWIVAGGLSLVGLAVVSSLTLALWRAKTEKAIYQSLFESGARRPSAQGFAPVASVAESSVNDLTGYWVSNDRIYVITDRGGDLEVRTFLNQLSEKKAGRTPKWSHQTIGEMEVFESPAFGNTTIGRGRGVRSGKSVRISMVDNSTLHAPNDTSMLIAINSSIAIQAQLDGETLRGVEDWNMQSTTTFNGKHVESKTTENRREFFATRRDSSTVEPYLQ